MAFIIEEDIFFDPINLSLFGVAGVMLDSDRVAHLVQEFFGAAFHVLCSKGLHERSKDRIISISRLKLYRIILHIIPKRLYI